MRMMENYLTVLEDSLLKKIKILDQLADYSRKQEELLGQETLSLEDFDTYVDKKDELVQALTKLDEGFETVYEHIKAQLLADKEAYKAQIVRLQTLISTVTEKSVSIQAQEARNKTMVEKHFSGMRKEMRQSVKGSKAAYDYYKSMSNTNIVSPQFMDQKK